MLWMKRFVYSFIGLILLAIVAVFVLRWWVLNTESGTGFALAQAEKSLGEQLSIGRHRGVLGDNLTINNLRYQAPGTAVDAQQIQVAADINLLPWPSVQIQRLQIDDVDVQLSESPAETEPEKSSGLPDLASPVAVTLDDLRINRASVHSGDGAEPIMVDSLQARLEYFEQLDLQQLIIAGDGFSINANGQSALSPPFDNRISVVLDNQNAAWLPNLQDLQADIQIQGSLQALTLNVSSSGALAMQLDATLRDLLDQPSWDLSLNNIDSALSWSAGGQTRGQTGGQADAASSGGVVITNLMLTSNGSLDDHNTQINVSLSDPEIIRGDWQLITSGDLQQLIIEQLSGPVLQGRITGSGLYDLQSGVPQAQFSLQLQDIKPDTGQAELAALPGVSGTLEARLDDQLLTLDSLNLRVPDTNWRVNGDGSYTLDTQQIAAAINWQQLSWPPQSGSAAQYASQQGNLKASGLLSDLDVELSTDVAGQQIPASDIDLRGHLTETAFAINQLLMQTLDGQVDIAGTADWQNGIEWDVSVAAEQINPGLQWPEFPGVIDLQATSNGSQSNDQIDAVLDIQTLDGSLRGQPVSGQGQLRYVNGSIRTDGLQLNSGDAQLDLQGNDQALQADISIPQLGDLLPNAAGAIEAHIQGESVDGGVINLDNLKLLTDISATGLMWQGVRVESILVNGDTALSSDSLLSDMQLTAQQVRVSDQAPINRIEATLSADNTQQLQLMIQHPQADIELGVNGDWDQWPSPTGWSGSVDTLSVNNQDIGEWALREPAAISLMNNDVLLKQLCINGPAGSSSEIPELCVDYSQFSGQFSAQASNQLSVDIQALPLALAEAFLNTGMRSEHQLSGNIQAGWSEQQGVQQWQQLDGQLQLSPGDIHFLDRDTPPLTINGGQLNVALTDQQRLHTQLQMTIEDSNRIESDLYYGPIAADAEQLSGTIKLDMPDMGWLRKPVPELDRVGGELHVLATLSGPATQPLVALDMDLQDGEIRYQPLGLQLSNLQLEGRSEPGETLNMSGGFSAGEGQAELIASLHPNTGVAELDIKGESLQLFNSDAIKVRISPDMQLKASPEGYQIAGVLGIPSALITPPEGSTSRVSESEDVVLVGVDQPQQPQAEPDSVPITGELKVVLGEHVRVDADVAETRLTGELDLLWDHQPIPKANGMINLVDGRVQAYGQTLVLENSRVVYNDTPADNPRLDIRAVRRIFGDPQVEEAGVAIGGPAQEPEISIYTNPATTEESALAYIATGSNFDHANGQGALNLGIYIFPKFFVSYGVGLFDNGNTANGRYEFSDNWNVSLQSGARDTGVDLNWRKDG